MASLKILYLAFFLLLPPRAISKEIPPNLLAFYNKVRTSGPCTGHSLLKGGFFAQTDGSPPLWSYCQRHIINHGFYIKGPGRALANMDVDCDGQNVPGDGRCGGSKDTQYETVFRDQVRELGIPDLNSYVHPYVVLGNMGRYWPTFDPKSVDVKPLSIVAVVCGKKLVYGVWGDVNGDDGPPLVGEASLALATECYGTGMNAKDGYDGTDVLYVAFSGVDAVPGNLARWNATDYHEFARSIEGLGDRLVARIGNVSGA